MLIQFYINFMALSQQPFRVVVATGSAFAAPSEKKHAARTGRGMKIRVPSRR